MASSAEWVLNLSSYEYIVPSISTEREMKCYLGDKTHKVLLWCILKLLCNKADEITSGKCPLSVLYCTPNNLVAYFLLNVIVFLFSCYDNALSQKKILFQLNILVITATQHGLNNVSQNRPAAVYYSLQVQTFSLIFSSSMCLCQILKYWYCDNHCMVAEC